MLLALRNEVAVIDILAKKVAMLNATQSPIEYVEIEDFSQNKSHNFRATLDMQDAHNGADYVIITTHTDRP